MTALTSNDDHGLRGGVRRLDPARAPFVVPGKQQAAATPRPPRSATLAESLVAFWRHPFDAEKRSAYLRDAARKGARSTVRVKETPLPKATRPQPPGERPDGDFHALLFDEYVRASLSRYEASEFVPYDDLSSADAPVSDVRVIAYYLPQFHPIPENDAWWGKGFTEWRNVARAFPQFPGHYQPRIPGELGYYDLRLVDVMRRQVALAKTYGIDAFCFHFYWFAGHTLLERPVRNFLNNPDLELGFSLCWANENWSRRWDGSEEELLITQKHSAEDDIAFIRYVAEYFRDPRYTRVNGRPVLTVYRPSDLPDPAATVARWRAEMARLGFEGIYLVATNAFGFNDYRLYGFDALSEFPPHHVRAPNIQDQLKLSKYRTGWRVRSYADVVEAQLQTHKPLAAVVHPGVMPSWDNSARRPLNGEIIHGSTPAQFGRWLAKAFDWASENPSGERLLFINAWNEWAEAAYLEPDSRFGYAYLSQCRAAKTAHATKAGYVRMSGLQVHEPRRRTVLACAHWAGDEVFGGERSFLDAVRSLAALDLNVVVTLPRSPSDAYLLALLEHVSEVRIFKYAQLTRGEATAAVGLGRFLDALAEIRPDIVYVNTIVVPGPLLAARMGNVPTVVHAREIIEHDAELQHQIGRPASEVTRRIARGADCIIANSRATAEAFSAHPNVHVAPNVVDLERLAQPNVVSGEVRFGLISSNFPKKGLADLVALAELCLTAEPRARFVIIGPARRVAQTLRAAGRSASVPANVEIVDYIEDPKDALGRVNVVLNFSHFQESFGRTVLEGMAAGRPAIAYRWGALPELIEDGVTGFLVPFGRPDAAIRAIRHFCADPCQVAVMGAAARAQAEGGYDFGNLRRALAGPLAELAEPAGKAATPYRDVRGERVAAQAARSIDIVVCVHNALEDAERCLSSVMLHTGGAGRRLVIVDDGSDAETRSYLEGLARAHPGVTLIRNPTAGGYTRAANAGLQATTADLVILLNSDTVVTPDWAEKMADAVFSTPGAGIVGPLSNAASYQSIPDTQGTATQTAVNSLAAGLTADEVNAKCEEWTTGVTMPYVPLVHGFCFGITREAIELIGNFDEERFPQGYGEENDYCLRALEHGVWPVVATHTFVFHAKSKSYSEARRSALAERSQQVLYEAHGRSQFLRYVEMLQSQPRLVEIRARAAEFWAERLAEFEAGAVDAAPDSVGALDDAAWLAALVASVESTVVDGVRFPGFPEAALQVGTVGSAGVPTMEEAFRFYVHVRAQAAACGVALEPRSRVLDFGVGWGRMIRCFVRDIDPANLYGVDVNDKFLTAARRAGVRANLHKITPRGHLEYEDGAFDAVYSYSVFTHLPKDIQELWLGEIHRVLRPGGILVATTQPPRFIDAIANVSAEKRKKSAWHRELSAQLELIGDAHAILRDEGFVFLRTNNGTTYGDTIMSPEFIAREWGRRFDVVDYLDEPSRFTQAVVTARKRER